MFILDEILELLKDGNWHPLDELVMRAAVNQHRVQTLIDFLARHDFVEISKAQRRARLTPLTHKFVQDIQRLEVEDMSALSSR